MHSTASDTTLSSDTCIAVCPSAIEITLPARIDVAVEMNGRAEQSQHTTSQNQQTTSMDMSASDPSQRALTDRVEVRMQSGHQSQPIPARQPILPTPRPHSCPEPTRPQQLAEVLVSVDPIAPPPYSPSREAPPPYRVQVKQVKTSKISHTLALVSLFLVTFDMDNVSAVLFYLVMLLIRLFLDIGTMVYMSPAFTTQPFFMSTFEFVLTLPVSGVRTPTPFNDNHCAFDPSIHDARLASTAQVGIDADAGRRAAAASAALEAMHRLSLQSHPQWSRDKITLIVSLSRPTRSSTQRQTPLIQLHEQNNGASLYPQWVFPRGTLLGEMEARQASSSPSAQSRTESTTN
ncbi:hypothetical protein BSLG_006624 [Batrachochytrium salamandrivorans]|nr:hypothetical protein BSLG_006624 [Batrachochytrium salamandrivorans]